MTELWYLHRGRLLVGAAVFAVLVLVLLLVAVAVRLTGGRATATNHLAAPVASTPASGVAAQPTSQAPASAQATDVAGWNAIPAVKPAASAQYPAIPAADADDPTSFVTAFATRLFTRDYATSSREQLIEWAQYEDAPLDSPNYPEPDWSKVLVDSLTDLTWDQETDTPIPADGPWLALQSENARQTVSAVKVGLDPQWEQSVAQGYQPTDRLATVRDVTLTVTRTAAVSGHKQATRFEVSFAVQLGTNTAGAYGVATTNDYVSREA